MSSETSSTTVERRKQEPLVGWMVTGIAGVMGMLALPIIAAYLVSSGMNLLINTDVATLFSATWRPSEEAYGLVPLVVGTLSTSLFSLLLAVPLGLGMAIHLRFYCGSALSRVGESSLGVLGGTPSVVFGLFGTVWLVPWLGPSLASATLVLTAMVLPTFTLLALATLRQLPKDVLAAGEVLGLRREQVIWHIALKRTWPLLAAAATLALSRCLGEALAVEMVCGNVPGIPTDLLQPIRTLTTTLVQEFEYARGAHAQALHLVALTVVLLAAATTTLALRLSALPSQK